MANERASDDRLSYRVEGVSQVFLDGEVTALDSIDFHFSQGSFTSLIGPSGCGKSTLLNILAGLLSPTTGSVTLGGTPVTGPRDEAGIMFQKATLLPWRTVLENLLLPIELSSGKKAAKAHTAQAHQLLETVGLKGFDGAYPKELSGGMAQRAAICRMLITEPDVFLLDEPFGALDELTRERMDLEIQRIAMSRHATVILVTHSIPEAVLLSDQVVAMSARPGRISEVIDIDLPRPRTLETMALPAFQAYVTRVRDALDRGHAHV